MLAEEHGACRQELAQSLRASHTWPSGEPVRVRVGLQEVEARAASQGRRGTGRVWPVEGLDANRGRKRPAR